MRLRVIDFETTGEPPEADVVEAAYVDVVLRDNWIDVEVPGWSTLVRSERPVDPAARAAHHLTDAEIATGSEWSGVRLELLGTGQRVRPTSPPDYMVAHNAAFERALLPDAGLPWLCTYKAALRLWEDAPRHSNQFLRYWLEGADPGEAGLPPHRALPDCRVTALVLVRCLERASVEQLAAWEREPAWKPVIGFGKHRGRRWTEVPRDYVAWVLKQDFDEDTKWNARQALGGGK